MVNKFWEWNPLILKAAMTYMKRSFTVQNFLTHIIRTRCYTVLITHQIRPCQERANAYLDFFLDQVKGKS